MAGTSGEGTLQAEFDDLYSAVYAVLDDAKAGRRLVKLYKGSHASPDPHPVVLDFGEFFFRERRGLLAYACRTAGPRRVPAPADLDVFDAEQHPRIGVRTVFDLLFPLLRRSGESALDVLGHVTARTHSLAAYRGGTSGYDEEARAFATAHFRRVGVPVMPQEVLVFCGGAKGVFMAFCAAVMCRRRHDDLRHLGGLMLAPAGYYQSLRLIPPVFGGEIHVADRLTGEAVRQWLADTAGCPRRCIYLPLVNNADGWVLTRPRAHDIARVVLEHNIAQPARPVYVLADDVYAGSYLYPGRTGTPIAAITGTSLGDPALGRMSDWTLSVLTPSKTFALPTARIAFAATTNPALRNAVGHYRAVLSQGRAPQSTELTAAAAICLTPQAWIDAWNTTYRNILHRLTEQIAALNTGLGFEAFRIDPPEGGWYLPLRVSPRLVPQATSSVDVFAALLHYAGSDRDSGVALLPGEMFGYRAQRDGEFLLRGTLAAGDAELRRFVSRLRDAAIALTGPDGAEIVEQARQRARHVADIDTILAHCRH